MSRISEEMVSRFCTRYLSFSLLFYLFISVYCLHWACNVFSLSLPCHRHWLCFLCGFLLFGLHGCILYAIRSLSLVVFLRQFQISMCTTPTANAPIRTNRWGIHSIYLSEAHFDNNDEMMIESRFLWVSTQQKRSHARQMSTVNSSHEAAAACRVYCLRSINALTEVCASASTDRNPMRQLHALRELIQTDSFSRARARAFKRSRRSTTRIIFSVRSSFQYNSVHV